MVVHKEGTSLIYVTAVHHISMSQYTHLLYLHPEQTRENIHIHLIVQYMSVSYNSVL